MVTQRPNDDHIGILLCAPHSYPTSNPHSSTSNRTAYDEDSQDSVVSDLRPAVGWCWSSGGQRRRVWNVAGYQQHRGPQREGHQHTEGDQYKLAFRGIQEQLVACIHRHSGAAGGSGGRACFSASISIQGHPGAAGGVPALAHPSAFRGSWWQRVACLL